MFALCRLTLFYVCQSTDGLSDLGLNMASIIVVKEANMSIVTILLIVLVIMLIGAVPRWPHSRNWGYAPSGGLGLIFLVLLILLLMGRI